MHNIFLFFSMLDISKCFLKVLIRFYSIYVVEFISSLAGSAENKIIEKKRKRNGEKKREKRRKTRKERKKNKKNQFRVEKNYNSIYKHILTIHD